MPETNAPDRAEDAAAPAFVARLEEVAMAARRAEIAWTEQAAAEARRLERERQFAWRRLGLARTLAAAARGARDAGAAPAAVVAALRRELGWHQLTDGRKRIVEAFAPVCAAIVAEARPEAASVAGAAGGPADTIAAGPGVEACLATFEAWHEATLGTQFLAHFDVELPEVPVVEF